MNQQGFTLLELLIVIAIISILSTVALPQYRKAINKSKAAEGITIARAAFEGLAMFSLTHRRCPDAGLGEGLNSLDIRVNPNGRFWTIGLTNVGGVNSRNCGITMTTVDQNPSFSASQIMVYTPSASGIPSGLTKGEIYWTCDSGDCKDFFNVLRVKKPSPSATYYQ